MGQQTVATQRPPWNLKHAVAGATAGLTTSLALHPLDVVKTRLQVQDGAGMLPVYRGTVDALRQIVREEGWRALYSGLTPALAGSGLAWGIYFYAYNRAKQRYQRQLQRSSSGSSSGQQQRLGPGMHLISAAEAGALVCMVTNPIWVVKTRLQLQRRTLGQAAAAARAAAGEAAAAATAAGAVGGGAAAAAAAAGSIPRQVLGAAGAAGAEACAVEYRGFVHAFVQIAGCEGLRGLYKGLLPSLLLVSHGAIQFAVYEELKSAAQHIHLARFTHSLNALPTTATTSSAISSSSSGGKGGGSGGGGDHSAQHAQHGGQHSRQTFRELSSAEISVFGALSKLVASVATYPSQVLRSRLQQRMDSRSLQYTGVGDAIRKTLQREGVGGFYKGLAPNVLRVMPQSALTFLVYESVMRLFEEQPAQRE